MEKPSPLQIQDFLLFMTFQNTILTLDAENESTEKIFTINLESDSIGQITNGLFDSVEKMVQGLKDAANGCSDGLTLVINSQGKLTYSVMLANGVIKKEYSSTLNLIEKEIEPIEIFGRRLNSVRDELENWKVAQDTKVEAVQAFQTRSEQRLDRLENMMIQLEQKMVQRTDILEKLCDTVKTSVGFEPDSYFNPASVNASKYALSDLRKTAKAVASSDSFSCLEILPQIPLNGKSSYSLRINIEEKEMVFGTTTETVKSNWNGESCSYWYSTKSGTIYGRCEKGPTEKSPFGGNNKIIKMVVDRNKGALAFFVDGRQTNSCEIAKSEKYFAYISFGYKGDSVTLI